MSFELSNGTTSFQSYINKIFIKKLNIFVLMYLDDILIYITDPGFPYVNEI